MQNFSTISPKLCQQGKTNTRTWVVNITVRIRTFHLTRISTDRAGGSVYLLVFVVNRNVRMYVNAHTQGMSEINQTCLKFY